MTQQVRSGEKIERPVISQCGAPTVMHRWATLSDTDSTIRREMETNGVHVCSDAQSSLSRQETPQNMRSETEFGKQAGVGRGIKSPRSTANMLDLCLFPPLM